MRTSGRAFERLNAEREERSLSRAAERLAMTQSAVSHALTRLRVLFKDQLFVRQARGVLPTPVADRIYAKLHRSLALTREAVTDRRGFDLCQCQPAERCHQRHQRQLRRNLLLHRRRRI